jgi:hypothetical protein
MANEEKMRKPAKRWQTGSRRGLRGRAAIVQPIATDWNWLGKVIGPAAATLERVRAGREKVYTAEQVRAELGLDD